MGKINNTRFVVVMQETRVVLGRESATTLMNGRLDAVVNEGSNNRAVR